LSGVFLYLGGRSLPDGQSQSVSVVVSQSQCQSQCQSQGQGVSGRLLVCEFALHDCKNRYSRGERLETRRVDLSWPAGWLARGCRKPKGGDRRVSTSGTPIHFWYLYFCSWSTGQAGGLYTWNTLRAGTLRYVRVALSTVLCLCVCVCVCSLAMRRTQETGCRCRNSSSIPCQTGSGRQGRAARQEREGRNEAFRPKLHTRHTWAHGVE
jgi:hypothetical protein